MLGYETFGCMTGQPRSSGNHQSGVVVGVSGITVGHTGENRLARTIGFVDTTTDRTGTAGVARVNRDNFDARLECLVFDEASQLCEGPRFEERIC